MQIETKMTKNMTALSRETAIISNVPSTNANPKSVKMKLYSTNETNSTIGKADRPAKTVKNKVAMGYSITKASTGATTTPMLVSFHFWKICKLKSPRLLTSCAMFSWGKDSMVNAWSKSITNASTTLLFPVPYILQHWTLSIKCIKSYSQCKRQTTDLKLGE